MRIFLTGAAGFIGLPALEELRSRGHEVACLLRTPSPAIERAGVETIAGDLLEADRWTPELASWRPDACLHAAWFTEPASYLNALDNVWLVRAGLELVDALSAAGCRLCLMLGTCAEYDTTSDGILAEDSPLRPTTLYASSKVALGLLARDRAERAGMKLAWARLFHPYGPRERPERLIASACRALAGGVPFAIRNPDARRDFVHVDDIARALADLVEAGAGGVFNIASGQATAVSDAIALIGEASGRSDLISVERRARPEWDPDAVWGSGERLAATTGWRPLIPLESGLASTFAWWAAQGASPG